MKQMDDFLEIIEGKDSSMKKFLCNFDEEKKLSMRILQGYGNSLIPSSFGRFPENFLVKLFAHSYEIASQIELAMFFSMDMADHADLYTQTLNGVTNWSEESRAIWERDFSSLRNYPAFDAESLACFR